MCWIAIAVTFAGVILLILHPDGSSVQIADWLKYYVLVGTLMTGAWMAATAPALLRNAVEVGGKEPQAVVIGLLLFGGAPVILLPLMVSAWPFLGLCAFRRWRQGRR